MWTVDPIQTHHLIRPDPIQTKHFIYTDPIRTKFKTSIIFGPNSDAAKIFVVPRGSR
jgi:hypothetical protein